VARRRRGAEGCAVQALDNRVVGAAPKEPGCEGRLIERGGTQPGRHGLLQAGQGAVLVLRFGLPTLRRRKRRERAIGERQDAVCRALPDHGRAGRGLYAYVAGGPVSKPNTVQLALLSARRCRANRLRRAIRQFRKALN